MYGSVHDAASTSPSQSAISRRGWGFHTVRGGVDPKGLCFRPPVVGGVDVYRSFRPGDGTLSSPGAFTSMSLSQSVIMGVGFPNRAGLCRPAESPLEL